MIDYLVILLLLFLSGCTITGNVVSNGVWIPIEDTGFMNDDALFSNTINSSLSYDFNGSSLTIITQKRDDFGIMNVYIDNELSQHDLYSANIEYQSQFNFTLEEGSHSLLIEVSGDKNEASEGYYVVVDEVVFGEVVSTSNEDIKESTLELRISEEPQLQNLDNTSHLAQIVNGKSIQDDYYIINTYLKNYNYFKNISYKPIMDSTNTLVTIGNEMDNVRGYELNGLNYSVHLVGCDKDSNSCRFRVNGINSGRIYASNVLENVPKTFNIDDNYQIKINSIEFDYCGGAIVCHRYYEAFDRVDMEILKK